MKKLSSAAEALCKGGHKEIEFELGVASNQWLRVALEAIWPHHFLAGCFLSRASSFAVHARVERRRTPLPIGLEVDFPRVACESVRRNRIRQDRFDGYLWNEDGQLKCYPPTNLHVVRLVNSGSGSEK